MSEHEYKLTSEDVAEPVPLEIIEGLFHLIHLKLREVTPYGVMGTIDSPTKFVSSDDSGRPVSLAVEVPTTDDKKDILDLHETSALVKLRVQGFLDGRRTGDPSYVSRHEYDRQYVIHGVDDTLTMNQILPYSPREPLLFQRDREWDETGVLGDELSAEETDAWEADCGMNLVSLQEAEKLIRLLRRAVPENKLDYGSRGHVRVGFLRKILRKALGN